jgi:hypothetical protein
MGDFSNPSLFQNALFNPDPLGPVGSWDLSQAGNINAYVSSQGGQDIRLDRFVDQLLLPESMHNSITATVFAGQYPLGSIQVFNPDSYGTRPVITNTVAAPPTSRMTFPAGQYNINVTFVSSTPQLALSTGVFQFNGAVINNFTTNYLNDTVQLLYFTVLNFDVSIPDWSSTTTQPYIDFVKDVASGATYSLMAMQVSSIFVPSDGSTNFPLAKQSGLTKQLRPVAMGVLFTCLLPSLTTGGMVAANLLPGGTVGTAYFMNNVGSNPGPLQNYENLNQTPGAKSYKLEKGCTVLYAGEDYDDLQFYRPNDANNNSYPAIVISGQHQPTPPPSVPTSYLVGRVSFSIVWEIETDSTLFGLSQEMCGPDDLSLALRFLSMQTLVMENPEHESWIRRMAEKIKRAVAAGKQFYENNQNWIVPVGKALGTAAQLGLSAL